MGADFKAASFGRGYLLEYGFVSGSFKWPEEMFWWLA
jgi:hypothetical protein